MRFDYLFVTSCQIVQEFVVVGAIGKQIKRSRKTSSLANIFSQSRAILSLSRNVPLDAAMLFHILTNSPLAIGGLDRIIILDVEVFVA